MKFQHFMLDWKKINIFETTRPVISRFSRPRNLERVKSLGSCHAVDPQVPLKSPSIYHLVNVYITIWEESTQIVHGKIHYKWAISHGKLLVITRGQDPAIASTAIPGPQDLPNLPAIHSWLMTWQYKFCCGTEISSNTHNTKKTISYRVIVWK